MSWSRKPPSPSVEPSLPPLPTGVHRPQAGRSKQEKSRRGSQSNVNIAPPPFQMCVQVPQLEPSAASEDWSFNPRLVPASNVSVSSGDSGQDGGSTSGGQSGVGRGSRGRHGKGKREMDHPAEDYDAPLYPLPIMPIAPPLPPTVRRDQLPDETPPHTDTPLASPLNDTQTAEQTRTLWRGGESFSGRSSLESGSRRAMTSESILVESRRASVELPGASGEAAPLTPIVVGGLPNEMLTRIVCEYLDVCGVGRMGGVCWNMRRLMYAQRWVKKCVLKGGVLPSQRKRFWLLYCADVPSLQRQVAKELHMTDMLGSPSNTSTHPARPTLSKGPSLFGLGSLVMNGGSSTSPSRGRGGDGGSLGDHLYEYLAGVPLDDSRSDEIRRDVSRTFPTHPRFRSRDSEGQLWLYSVLHALVALDPTVGYCQGMNFLVAGLLIHLECPVSAFWMALAVLRHFDFALIFSPGVPLLSCRLYQFSNIVRNHLPDLWHHLHRNSLNVDFFAHQWFMTIFAYYLEPSILGLVWDLFFVAGWKMLFKVGVTLLASLRPTLLALDVEGMLRIVQSSKRAVEMEEGGAYRQFLASVASYKVTNAQLRHYCREYQIVKFLSVIQSVPLPTNSSRTENDNFPAPNSKESSQVDPTTLMEDLTRTWTAGSGPHGGGEPLRGVVVRAHQIMFVDMRTTVTRDVPLQGVSYSRRLQIRRALIAGRTGGKSGGLVRRGSAPVPLYYDACTSPTSHGGAAVELRRDSLIAFVPPPMQWQEENGDVSAPSGLFLVTLVGGSEMGRYKVLQMEGMIKLKLMIHRMERQTAQDTKSLMDKIAHSEKQFTAVQRDYERCKQRAKDIETAWLEAKEQKQTLSATLRTLVHSSSSIPPSHAAAIPVTPPATGRSGPPVDFPFRPPLSPLTPPSSLSRQQANFSAPPTPMNDNKLQDDGDSADGISGGPLQRAIGGRPPKSPEKLLAARLPSPPPFQTLPMPAFDQHTTHDHDGNGESTVPHASSAISLPVARQNRAISPDHSSAGEDHLSSPGGTAAHHDAPSPSVSVTGRLSLAELARTGVSHISRSLSSNLFKPGGMWDVSSPSAAGGARGTRGSSGGQRKGDQGMIMQCLQKVIQAERAFDSVNMEKKESLRQLHDTEETLSELKEVKERYMQAMYDLVCAQEQQKRDLVWAYIQSGQWTHAIPPTYLADLNIAHHLAISATPNKGGRRGSHKLPPLAPQLANT
ncbi:unnamed protein product [Vitrella brassicaformis CCMP3155]|uniref:Rab-GAP TBC domain-containing protein n=2 Tax=Vitrella brassicaformis TaxID=1169539 RepID=A0A0G4ECK3_VITBC|nr:unnamed protein product [Vitrella brassicaformis CCMP3155]|eukprot:CEL93467.1 unnamed protein product [Vitrella brassicaformis CCMP3155]